MLKSIYAKVKSWFATKPKAATDTTDDEDSYPIIPSISEAFFELGRLQVESRKLHAANKELRAALEEAISEYQDAIAYKSEYLVEKHHDLDTIADLNKILRDCSSEDSEVIKNLQAKAIENLKFPVQLRKMWTGAEVQQWLEEQACQKRK